MGKKRKNKNVFRLITSIVMLICIIIYVQTNESTEHSNNIENTIHKQNITFNLDTIPEYSTIPYIEINNNIPSFKEGDYKDKAFEEYSEWDNLGRSGVAFGNICLETMPKQGEEREEISSIKNLSGWVQKRYDNLIKDKYLYNRCHLIGWQLSAENANKENLITGTRYMNTEGMLPFENKVSEYIRKNKKNHVLYRVTPVFEGNNLLASGVQMEAFSVEDNGKGIQFNVYCYNVQPGITINYETGESHET